MASPENPADLIPQAMAVVKSKNWEFYLAYGFGGSLCGAMVLFLICVYLWRPVLVNRVSLRLIFAISIYDFIECALQATAQISEVSARCRATMFFSAFFGYASVYTSSSIAINLHITLMRRGGRSYLPPYVEYLYFIVPLVVALLHWAPPTIWAAVHGYCSAFSPIDTGTPAYILYVTFVQLLLPMLALLFNVIVSLRVIGMLLLQQRLVNRSLKEVMDNTRKHVLGSGSNTSHDDASSDSSTRIYAEDDGCGYTSAKATKELELNLIVMRKFNSAAIRIALYPFAPIAWWLINVVYYSMQYSLTMTYKADVDRWVRMMSLAWFSMPAIAFANFLVFVTDPAFRKVIREVHKSLANLDIFSSRGHNTASTSLDQSEFFHGSARSTFSTLQKPDVAAVRKEHGDNTSLLIRSSSESSHQPPWFEQSDIANTAIEPSARTTAVLTAFGEMIRRHPTVGNGANANYAYSKI
ncbi:hypothetical protein H4R26_003931 [Coemansia thaxteri]|uniref:Uncharacterized protein n=1 Tax=Coemansia thaxteri TaxID=2663907 RepID=A0A9W8EIP4_9FUNG|nr:hypothetical protein H4R26_003931 [Coemansia thaxteri]